MPARLGPLGDDEVDPGGLLTAGVLGRAGQRGDHDAPVPGLADQVRGRRAQRARDQPDGVAERDVEEGARGLRGDAEGAGRGPQVLGEFGHAVAGEHVLDEGDVLGREQRGREPPAAARWLVSAKLTGSSRSTP